MRPAAPPPPAPLRAPVGASPPPPRRRSPRSCRGPRAKPPRAARTRRIHRRRRGPPSSRRPRSRHRPCPFRSMVRCLRPRASFASPRRGARFDAHEADARRRGAKPLPTSIVRAVVSIATSAGRPRCRRRRSGRRRRTIRRRRCRRRRAVRSRRCRTTRARGGARCWYSRQPNQRSMRGIVRRRVSRSLTSRRACSASRVRSARGSAAA